VVTICTASLTFSNSTFSPHTVFMCFVWISEQTAIISLYNINWLVFITQTQCVYCAVRAASLNVIQVKFAAQGMFRTPSDDQRSLCLTVTVTLSSNLLYNLVSGLQRTAVSPQWHANWGSYQLSAAVQNKLFSFSSFCSLFMAGMCRVWDRERERCCWTTLSTYTHTT